MYCNNILSILDALGSGDSIKKGNIMTLLLQSFITIKIGKKINFFNILVICVPGLVLYELYRTSLELSKRQISEKQTHPRIEV